MPFAPHSGQLSPDTFSPPLPRQPSFALFPGLERHPVPGYIPYRLWPLAAAVSHAVDFTGNNVAIYAKLRANLSITKSLFQTVSQYFNFVFGPANNAIHPFTF
jgi:hypothetical protein